MRWFVIHFLNILIKLIKLYHAEKYKHPHTVCTRIKELSDNYINYFYKKKNRPKFKIVN